MTLTKKEETRAEKEKILFSNLKKSLPELEELLTKIEEEWSEPDLFYRYYHQSFKVYYIQSYTKEIVEKLKSLLPEQKINERFLELYNKGTGQKFEYEHNKKWHEVCGPMLECYFHAKTFLRCGITSAKMMEEPTNMLRSDWAAFLYFYNLR